MRIVFTPLDNNGFLKRLQYLDSLVYLPEDQSTLEYDTKRYMKNKESHILMYDNDEIVGYLCYYPISESLFDEIKYGKYYDDTYLSSNDVLVFESNRSYSVYIMSVVLHPDYQNKSLSKMFLKALKDKEKELKNKNIVISNWIAIAVSKQGERFSKSLGLEVINQKEDKKIMLLEGDLHYEGEKSK